MRHIILLSLLIACNPNDNGSNSTSTDTDCPESERSLFWIDADGDGYGDPDESLRACALPDGYADNGDDCDDTDASIYPGAPDDQCNGVDNNCDGTPDTDAPDVTRYPDRDGDGWGVTEEEELGCLPLDSDVHIGFTDQPGDCDDTDPHVYPGAPQRCDGKANPCEGPVDDGLRGTGEDCPADHCQDVADDHGGESGEYWLMDDEGSYLAECHMRSDGAYTRITSAIIAERGWVSFAHVGGPDGAWEADFDGDAFTLRPYRPASFSGGPCRTVVVRAFLNLPFTFTHWEGGFNTTYTGNDTTPVSWGLSLDGPEPCDGAVKFGVTGEVDVKRGSEWGRLSGGTSSLDWDNRALAFPSDTILWEINDFDDTEAGGTKAAYLTVRDFGMYVR